MFVMPRTTACLILLSKLTNGGHFTGRQVCLRHTSTTPVGRKNCLFCCQTTVSVCAAEFTDRLTNYSIWIDSQRPQNINQSNLAITEEQESRAVARKPRDAAAVLFGLKFDDDIHYKFKSSQASKAKLQSYKYTDAKQNLTQNGHSRSRALGQWKGDKGLSIILNTNIGLIC